MNTFVGRFFVFILLNFAMLLPAVLLGLAAQARDGGTLPYGALYGVTAVGSLLLLAWVYRRKRRGSPPLRQPLPPVRTAARTALCYFILLLCIGPLYEWLLPLLGWSGGVSDLENQRLLAGLLAAMPLTMSLHIVLYAPLAEELLYRGILFQDLRGGSGKAAVLLPAAVSALIFALMHSPMNHPGFMLYFLMGGIFGLVYLHTGRLHYAVAVHLANNLLSCLQMLDAVSVL